MEGTFKMVNVMFFEMKLKMDQRMDRLLNRQDPCLCEVTNTFVQAVNPT